ncbi:hypothetical protein NLJ89_g12387 [Agrocybe chaxingu]|uniref:Uncharacterized protein n=1 Tax=Agrocybe chaxingu TaxID=84603 RepID=A0A9W8MP47_9AGAR|nr:hypothetical protein NLJ89_g12387 [Agrocybe chaxingu]
MTHTTTASTSAASASTSSTSAPPISPSNSSDEEYPEFLDFNNPAVANEVTRLLNEAAEALAKPQTDDKGKGVAR